MSADGKLALPTRVQTRISNEEDMRRVHLLRARSDAILVGIGTVLRDNPKLTVKRDYIRGKFKNPIRIVIDSKCRIPESANLLDGKVKTIVACAKGYKKKLKNAEVLECGRSEVNLRDLLTMLRKMDIRKLLVEGGSRVIGSFLNERLVDELRIFVGSFVIGGENAPTLAGGEGAKSLEEVVKLKLKNVKRLGDGVLLQYKVLK